MGQAGACGQLCNLHLLTRTAAVQVKEQRSRLLAVDKPLGCGFSFATQAELLRADALENFRVITEVADEVPYFRRAKKLESLG